MKPITILLSILMLSSCQEDNSVSSDKSSIAIQPIIQTYLPSLGSNGTGRLNWRQPNGLVVSNGAGELKLFPFLRNTFYGNGGGRVVGTGWSIYNKNFAADWNNDGKTDLVSRDQATSLYYSRYINNQFVKQIGDVGIGFASPIYLVGEWGTPSGGDPDTPDLLGINYAGNMTIYPFKSLNNFGTGSFKNSSSISAGTIPFIYTHFFVADWSGDGLSDMICRDSNGNMDYYVYSNSSSQFVYTARVGHAWFFTDYFIVDQYRDGIADNLLVRDNLGNIKLYPFKNQTFYGNNGGTIVGSGFNYTHYFVGDWNPAGLPQIIGRDQNGNMYLHDYTNRTSILGTYENPVLVGHGWFFNEYFMGTW